MFFGRTECIQGQFEKRKGENGKRTLLNQCEVY